MNEIWTNMIEFVDVKIKNCHRKVNQFRIELLKMFVKRTSSYALSIWKARVKLIESGLTGADSHRRLTRVTQHNETHIEQHDYRLDKTQGQNERREIDS